MGSFGEDLRMERLNRGIALEKITEVTKISPRHLRALEENEFRVLPGGILNKGIVRGYVSVLGLDELDWVSRFQRAYMASGEVLEDDRNWIEFAANVGRARVRPRDAATERLKWAGDFCCFWWVWLDFLRFVTTDTGRAGGRRWFPDARLWPVFVIAWVCLLAGFRLFGMLLTVLLSLPTHPFC